MNIGSRLTLACIVAICPVLISATDSQVTYVVEARHPSPRGPFGNTVCAQPTQNRQKFCFAKGKFPSLAKSKAQDLARAGLRLPTKFEAVADERECLWVTVSAVPDHAGTYPNYRCLSDGYAKVKVTLKQ